MKKIGIYKITSPSGKVYIGQSIDIDLRFKDYKSLRCHKQILLYNSLKKYGFENHKFEIITFCDIKQLNDLERYYQDLYSVLADNGMNLKLTETNDRCGKRKPFSIETRLKMSLAKKGKKRPPRSLETRLKISNTRKNNEYLINQTRLLGYKRKGKKASEETLKKMILASKGKKQTEEQKLKISLALKGKKKSEETRKKMSLAQKNRKQKLNLSLQYGEQTEKSGQEGI